MSASQSAEIGLPEALERAASALPALADAIRPANGDPDQLANVLGDDDARAVLAWLLEHESGAGGELALHWAEDPERVATVLALSTDALPKAARKALRRVHHRLRSRGIDVPEPEASATVAKLPPMDEAIDEAFVTGLDPHGARLVYLASDRAGGGVRLFEVAIDGARGVLELEVFEAGRGRARRYLREIGKRESWPAAPVPPASARALIAAAAASQSAERRPPRGFVEWRSRLCAAPEGTPTPGALARAALAPVREDDREALNAATQWAREGRIGPWPPPLERVQPLLDRLREIAEGVVVVSEAASDAQIDAALVAGLTEVYDEAQRERLAAGLEETAYVWWKTEGEASARTALAAAAGVRALPISENPIARAMLERLLQPAIERARAGKETPAEDAAPAVEG
jgi:hypothetical protein